jgi:hypothetical protein
MEEALIEKSSIATPLSAPVSSVVTHATPKDAPLAIDKPESVNDAMLLVVGKFKKLLLEPTKPFVLSVELPDKAPVPKQLNPDEFAKRHCS